MTQPPDTGMGYGQHPHPQPGRAYGHAEVMAVARPVPPPTEAHLRRILAALRRLDADAAVQTAVAQAKAAHGPTQPLTDAQVDRIARWAGL